MFPLWCVICIFACPWLPEGNCPVLVEERHSRILLILFVCITCAFQAAAGRSTGKEGPRATRHREDLAAAMNDCARAVPCWIMPTWRISQCLPAEVASFDLVVLDEASQSDVTALTALMRGARVLVVGDQKQVRCSCKWQPWHSRVFFFALFGWREWCRYRYRYRYQRP